MKGNKISKWRLDTALGIFRYSDHDGGIKNVIVIPFTVSVS